jgi:hypothetical protein
MQGRMDAYLEGVSGQNRIERAVHVLKHVDVFVFQKIADDFDEANVGCLAPARAHAFSVSVAWKQSLCACTGMHTYLCDMQTFCV